MSSTAEILVGLEKRIIALERLAGITPEVSTLVHPKSVKQADFRAAEAVREAKKAAKLKATIGVTK